jgi:hypothetical protein
MSLKGAIVVGMLCMFTGYGSAAQELYPNTEPASTFPYKTLGIRLMSEVYSEGGGFIRNMNALRLMYGVTPKLSVYLSAASSNHHKKTLPPDYPYHNTPERGVYKPYYFNGFSLYSKYRFLSIDKEKEHLRMAVYAEGSLVNSAHDEGEPRLLDDTKGFGFGYIGTYLKNKFAASITIGGIFPGQFVGEQTDLVHTLPNIPTRVKYPNALNYSLSLGYLVLPKAYNSYKQTNLNVYVELMGKAYGNTYVWVTPAGVPEYMVENARIPPALRKNVYLDIVPGIQFIFNSNTRVDLSANLSGYQYSFARLYPQINIGIQHYFYLR